MGVRSAVLLCGLLFGFASSVLGVDVEPRLAAQKALFSARYKQAAEMYADLLKADPKWDFGYYAQVRALLEDNRREDAYAVAEKASMMAPDTPGTETAQGLVALRRGELGEADKHFRKALKIDQKYSPALRGLAGILAMVSKFESARVLRKEACRDEAEDPQCFGSRTADMSATDRIHAMEQSLALYDPESRQAKRLRVRIAYEKSLGDRKPERLTTPYQSYEIPLQRTFSGMRHDLRGFTVHLTINGKKFNVLLDTGASGLSISPKSAKRAGLEGLGDETGEVRGIGDDKAQASHMMLASEVRVGDLAFADVPIEAAGGVSDDSTDGLIGGDFFRKFLVILDFSNTKLTLEAFPTEPGDRLPDSPDKLDPGFVRGFRLGSHFFLPTAINRKEGYWFLIDSGGAMNLVDVETVRPFTGTYNDGRTRVKGVQGEVRNVSRAAHLDLIFAGFRQDNEGVIAVDLTKLGDDFGFGISGILGMPVLQRMTLTMNYVQGAVRFEYHK